MDGPAAVLLSVGLDFVFSEYLFVGIGSRSVIPACSTMPESVHDSDAVIRGCPSVIVTNVNHYHLYCQTRLPLVRGYLFSRPGMRQPGMPKSREDTGIQSCKSGSVNPGFARHDMHAFSPYLEGIRLG